MSKIVPNTFQTPNLYVDRLMSLLTDAELRILIYMTRRILGFQRREDKISLSQFTTGLILTSNNEHLDYGAGVSKEAARTALDNLVKFNIVTQTQPYDSAKRTPATWSLQLDDALIDWEALSQRKETVKIAGAERAAKRVLSQSSPPVPATSTPPPVLTASTGGVLTVSTPLSNPVGQPCTNGLDTPVLTVSTTKTRGKPEESQKENQIYNPPPPILVTPNGGGGGPHVNGFGANGNGFNSNGHHAPFPDSGALRSPQSLSARSLATEWAADFAAGWASLETDLAGWTDSQIRCLLTWLYVWAIEADSQDRNLEPVARYDAGQRLTTNYANVYAGSTNRIGLIKSKVAALIAVPLTEADAAALDECIELQRQTNDH